MALLGIDLGTTNSADGRWTNTGSQSPGGISGPSVVHIDKSHLSVGEIAKAQRHQKIKTTDHL